MTKKKLLLFFAFSMFMNQAFSQTKHGAGAAPSAGAGAGGSGSVAAGAGGAAAAASANAQTGFVYYLKYKWHMQFASTRSETYYFTKKQLKQFPGIMTMFGCKNDSLKLITGSFILDRKVNRKKWTGVPSFTGLLQICRTEGNMIDMHKILFSVQRYSVFLPPKL
jgi:hypothetical protein